MLRPVAVEAREGRRIWLRYSDGAAGEVDLSDMTGKGVFKAWDEPGCFEQVHIDAPDIDLCPYAIWKSPPWDDCRPPHHLPELCAYGCPSETCRHTFTPVR